MQDQRNDSQVNGQVQGEDEAPHLHIADGTEADGKKRKRKKKQADITEDAKAGTAILIPANLAAIVGACSTENTRYSLGGVRVTILENNQYRLDATDGRCAVIVTGEAESFDDFPYVERLDDISPRTTQAIIPHAIWKKAFAGAPKRSVKAILMNVAMAFSTHDGKLITTDFETGANVTSFRQLDPKFPPIDDVIPKNRKPKAQVRFSPGVLIKALSVADALARDKDELCAVEMSIFDENSAVLLTASTDKGQRVTAVVMPVTRSNVDTKEHSKKEEHKATLKEKIRLLMQENSGRVWNALRAVVDKKKCAKAMEEARRLVSEVRKDITEIDAWVPTGYTKTQEELDAEAAEEAAAKEAKDDTSTKEGEKTDA